MWQGRLDTEDGALQLLLLVDYIFDWARDLYRFGIRHLLKLLSNNFDDNASISTDSQVLSMRHDIGAWLAQSHSITDLARDVETNDLSGTMAELWQNTDTVDGVFRHSSLFETCFQSFDLRKHAFRNTPVSHIAKDSPTCARSFFL